MARSKKVRAAYDYLIDENALLNRDKVGSYRQRYEELLANDPAAAEKYKRRYLTTRPLSAEKVAALAQEILNDVSALSEDIRKQRESMLFEVGLGNMRALELDRLQQALNDAQSTADENPNDMVAQSKVFAIGKYLDYRNGTAFKAPLGYGSATLAPNGKTYLALALQYLYDADREQYAALWESIADLIGKAHAPANVVPTEPVKYKKRWDCFDKQTEVMFDKTKNEPYYHGAGKKDFVQTYRRRHIYVPMKLEYEGISEEDLNTKFFDTCRLDYYDRKVCMAICAIYKKRYRQDDKYVIIPLNEIYEFVYDSLERNKRDSKDPELQQLADIRKSCERLNMTRVYLDLTDYYRAGRTDMASLKGPIITYYETSMVTEQHGQLLDCIVLGSLAPLPLEYANVHKLVEQPRIKALDAPEGKKLPNSTAQYMRVKESVAHRANKMRREAANKKRKKAREEKKGDTLCAGASAMTLDEVYTEDQRTIWTETMYAEAGIDMTSKNRGKRNRLRGLIENALDELIASNTIHGWTTERAGKKIVGYCLTLEAPKQDEPKGVDKS